MFNVRRVEVTQLDVLLNNNLNRVEEALLQSIMIYLSYAV